MNHASKLRRIPLVPFLARSVGGVLNHRVPALLRDEASESAVARSRVDPNASTGSSCQGAGAGDELPLDPVPIGAAGNPVVTAGDVTDFGDVDFVADPFAFPGPDRWHLFFEVCNYARDPDAVIGHATSPNGIRWEYDGAVLNTGEHLSFPYVFEWEDARYMIPEEGGSGGRTVRVYEATEFPTEWTPCATPVSEGHRTDDTVAFRWRDRWWLIVGDSDIAGFRIYHSDSLRADDWQPHEQNPVVTDRPAAFRPGGRPIVCRDRIIAFYQDCERQYGDKVRAFEITDLDPETYRDRERPESPVLEGTGGHIGWNAGRMHHIDPWYVDGEWFCVADGNIAHSSVFTGRHWALGVYSTE